LSGLSILLKEKKPASAVNESTLPAGIPYQVGRTIATGSRGGVMLWTIFVILLVLWLLGLVSSYTLGGFIHILLVLALVLLVINLLSGRRVV
jgi:Family of unknown function (DUF5670)